MCFHNPFAGQPRIRTKLSVKALWTIVGKGCKGLYSPSIHNPLADDKILHWSKLKQIADNILKCIQNEKSLSYRVENVVRKEEIA